MTGFNYLNSGSGAGGTDAVSIRGRAGNLSAKRSASGAIRKFGIGRSSFTMADVHAAYPQHAMGVLAHAVVTLVNCDLAKRISPGIYRLTGEV